MHVVATAGHVDHGKSTLVRALTGMEPDRFAEEQRRGLTIDLGFVWTTLPSGHEVAFVDVPGHERFVATMLAGVGPVPAVLLVVAADEGWMPQSAEHLAALDAFGVRRGLVVVTRADLADPAPAMARAREEVAQTSLGEVPAVAVSAVTGGGLDDLRDALAELVASLQAPDRTAPVRLWVDRAFTIAGSGTVVTGTLAAGTVRVGDGLVLSPSGRRVRVRGLQTLKHPAREVGAVARVALNLRGVARDEVARGNALLTPDAWLRASVVDVRLRGVEAQDVPRQALLHIGAATDTVAVRPLGADTARLSLRTPLPLRIGDRAVLRDPGSRRVAGAVVLDVRPPRLARRGAAAARSRVLDTMGERPDGEAEVRRRGLVQSSVLRAMGADVPYAPLAGDWVLHPDAATRLRARLAQQVTSYAEQHPLEPGLPTEAARRALGLPDVRLVEAVAGQPGEPVLGVRDGRVALGAVAAALPPQVSTAVEALRRDLSHAPFAAPDAARLQSSGLGPKELAAAVRVGALLKLADGVYLLPGADTQAVAALGALPQPFTTSEARKALGTSRRVAIPLLELLDRRGLTRRLPDDRREVVRARAAHAEVRTS